MKKIVFATIMILCSLSAIQAQKKDEVKKDKEKLLIKLQDGATPIIYVNGKVFDFPMELIDQTKIESIFVVKGKDAIAKYKAPNGVVLIKTKGAKQLDFSYVKAGEHLKEISNKNYPKVIIDGKVTDKKTLDKLSSSIIEKMEVVKGEKAIKKYNAPNGVIIITTKKM
tara:strand:+ start:35050 stop:35553 length:504 start_codon:yes stop_codon:yes gene_type:complete